MSPTRRVLLLAAPAILRGAAASAARPAVGEVSAVTGAATASHPDDPPRPLRPAAPVLLDDILGTGAGARLACRMEGGMMLRLGENATLRVDALTLQGPAARVDLRSFGGALLFDRPTPPAAPLPATTLHMPWARIGVRGTRFFAGPLDDVHAVFVARGQVEVEAEGGGRARLEAGEGVDVPLTGAATLPVRRWGPPRIARAMALVE